MLKARATATMILGAIVSLAICLGSAKSAKAQSLGRQPVHFNVSGPVERLEMIVNTSRILTTEHKVPQLLVENQGIIRAQPISPNQVQLSALKAGFTTLTVWDENQGEHTIDVLVYGDARELENLLMTEFPEATLRVRPLATSVVISGFVPRAEMVSRIVRMAEDYYPSVINNITIGGVQQVLLHVKLMEVSRTKLRQLGFDWANFNGNDGVAQSVAGLVSGVDLTGGAVASSGGETVAFGIVNNANSFFGFIDFLRKYNLVKVLAEPTLVTISGRPASFSSGGEFPILVPQAFNTISIEYREFGTRVDFVPIVLGNGRVRLEVRPQVSEIDPSRSVSINNTTVPGLRTRWVDTGVEMKAGQTLALAGLIQNQIESENVGLPWLSDLPWIGSAFRRVREQNNEIELLILVTPEFVDALDADDVPPCGPGQLTTSPSDTELYFKGYLEKPKCCPDGSCSSCASGVGPATFTLPNTYGPTYEPVPAVQQPISASVHDRFPPRSGNLPPNPPVTAGGRGVGNPSLIGPTGFDVLP
ncbi:MAG: type II and III secretion system protein family protein [Planctomycetota bacterium]|nr:type II and III secretion system protein family protein [Planctomycetota bacterium]